MMTQTNNTQHSRSLAVLAKQDMTMSMAIIIAVTAHALLIFGVSFSTNKDPAAMVQDVAKVLSDNMDPNKDAKYIANASQVGGGEVRQQLRQESKQISPMSDQQMQETQDIINLDPQVRPQQAQQSYLHTTLSWRDAEVDENNDNEKQSNDLIAQETRLRKQIATLEAQLSQREQVFATKSKVVTVDGNSTTKGDMVEYVEQFRHQVEEVGNQYYPPQALAQGITGEVRLMVIIKPNGYVKAIRLLESSGSVILDEAAKQSVREAAPFGKFTAEMKDVAELRLIRTYRYSDTVEVTF